ncbi:murein biosynthesis integral membrane protein MurJ [Candidatus Omnitrophota bacterium]
MSTNKILRSASVIGFFTLLSRILGFIRDIVIAKFFGATLVAEAFFVAFRIPNLLRNLIGEGSVNAAIVPVLSDYAQKEKKKDFLIISNIVMFIGLLALSAVTLLGIIFAPLIVRLIAPGFMQDSYQLDLTIRLTRIMFPYLLLIGLTACSMGILHSVKSFFSSAVGPCLLNISLIASSIVAANVLDKPIFGLAIGVITGGILQLAIQLPYLYKIGFRVKRVKTLFHPAVKLMRSLLIPRFFGAAVYQLNVLVDTICASLSFIVGSGAVAAIYYANRIIQFPLAVFGIALAQAVLPDLSRLATQNTAELRNTILFCLKGIILVMVPATFALAILAQPIIQILFQRGSFDAYATAITSSALLFYAVGLFAFAGIKIMVNSFHALKDTKTPAQIAALCLVINASLNVILMWKFKVAGIALASSLSAGVNFILLFYLLNKRIARLFTIDLMVFTARVILFAGLMGIVVYLTWNNLFVNIHQAIRLLSVLATGLISFTALCMLFGTQEKEFIASWISRKK